jgi:cell division protein FtsB
MKKNPSIKNFILIVLAVAVTLISYVATVTEIKNINRQKIIKQDLVKIKHSSIEMKIVEIQKLTAEDLMVAFARDSLGLIRPNENLDTISVSKNYLRQIEKFVNTKYD